MKGTRHSEEQIIGRVAQVIRGCHTHRALLYFAKDGNTECKIRLELVVPRGRFSNFSVVSG